MSKLKGINAKFVGYQDGQRPEKSDDLIDVEHLGSGDATVVLKHGELVDKPDLADGEVFLDETNGNIIAKIDGVEKTFSTNPNIIYITAPANIPANRFLKFDGNLPTSGDMNADFPLLGVSLASALTGELLPVQISGIADVYNIEETIEAGNYLRVGVDGYIFTAANQSSAVGTALTAGGNETLISVLFHAGHSYLLTE